MLNNRQKKENKYFIGLQMAVSQGKLGKALHFHRKAGKNKKKARQ
jgi:hypothetical protein